MRQQQAFRGFIFILLMLILIAMAVWLPHVRQADKVTNRGLIQILDDRQVLEVVIHQSPQALANEMTITVADRQVKHLYVTDVKDIQKIPDDHKVEYMAMDVPQGNYLVIIILPFMLSIVMVVIITMVVGRNTGGGSASVRMMNSGKSRTRMSRDSKVNSSSVAGLVEEKEELEKVVGFPKNSQKYISVGAKIPKGFLLVEPPGTGKTLPAKAMAGKTGVPFFSISGFDLVEAFVGVEASRVRGLFGEAEKNSPCIVFIDEIGAVTRHRGTDIGGGHDEREQTLNQSLVEMDGFGINEGIIMMAATNRVGILDPAILRPGRSDREATVGRSDVKGRKKILKVYPKDKPLSEDMGLHHVAQITAGSIGADLENLMNEVAIVSARGNHGFIERSDIGRTFVEMRIDAEKKSRVISGKGGEVTAYHEAGHTTLFHVPSDVGPIHTVSVIPTGIGATGYTMPLSEEDEMSNIRGRTFQNTMVDLGGHIAEELIFDDITTGTSQSIKQATQIARAIVTQYGVSDKVGMIQYGSDDNEILVGHDLAYTKSYGNGVADTIDSEVKRIINGRYQKVTDTIKQYDYVLHSCTALLIEKEKINQEEFETLFAPAQ